MSAFEDAVIQRIKQLEREVERLQRWERPTGGGVTDHGALTGLGDDDHPQYLLTTGKAADSDKLDGTDSTGFATATHNHTGTYLPIDGKAADSDKLDGVDITAFKGLNSLADPNADRVLFWDESAGALKWLTVDGIVDTDLGKWQSWTPASQTGWTAMPTGTFRYVNIGKLVILEISVTAGTSNNATTEIALPFTAASSGGWTGTMGFAMNNEAAILTATRWNIAAGAGSIYFFTDMGGAGWAASGTKLVNCVAIYEKA